MKRTVRHITIFAITALAAVAMAMPAAAKPNKGKAKGHAKYHKPVFSQTYMPAERYQVPQWAEQKISYSQAKSIARSRYPGAEVVDIRLKGNTYRVRLVLQNSQMVDVLIDAVSGRIR